MRRLLASLVVLFMAIAFLGLATLPSFAFDPLNVCEGSSNPDCVQLCEGEAASSPACQGVPNANPENNPISGSNGVIKRIAVLISVITGIASGILIIIGTIKYITSAGDANSISSAKKTIIYALVGVLVTLFAQGIIVFVLNKVK